MLHLLIYRIQTNVLRLFILWLTFSQWTHLAGLRRVKICQLAHFIAFLQKYDEYDELHIVFDRYDIPKSLKSATRHLRLGDSYHVEYHSTDTKSISKVPLNKLLSHTTTKDELTVF